MFNTHVRNAARLLRLRSEVNINLSYIKNIFNTIAFMTGFARSIARTS